MMKMISTVKKQKGKKEKVNVFYSDAFKLVNIYKLASIVIVHIEVELFDAECLLELSF